MMDRASRLHRPRTGYFRAWLTLKGWGWGPHSCDFATLPVGDHGWKRIA